MPCRRISLKITLFNNYNKLRIVARKQMQDYNTTTLLKRQKVLNILIYGIILLLITYGIIMFYQMMNQTWNTRSPIAALPFLLFAVAVIIGRYHANISAELKKREVA